MFLWALGPLGFSHEDLWRVTLGELSDLIAAGRYRDYISARRDARLACWIANGVGMRTEVLQVEDLVGYWAEGRIMNKMAYYDYSKRKVLERKRKGGAVS